MYGMGLAMYLTMIGFQLPLLQTTALPSRLNKEASTMNVHFNTIGLCNRKKGDL
jgi:hypothetical protein